VSAIVLRDVWRSYATGAVAVEALRGVSLEIAEGSAVAVVGPSGSGKSSLLHLCGAVDAPTSGEVRVLGTPLHDLSEEARTRFRRDHLGFVFQFFHLLSTLDALENVMVPARLAGRSAAEAEASARAGLERLGLGARMANRPSELSGGEQQRVAIARALVLSPRIVLADEPSGNLDAETGAGVIALLLDLARAEGRTVVMVTHDERAAAACDRIVRLRDGRVESAG